MMKNAMFSKKRLGIGLFFGLVVIFLGVYLIWHFAFDPYRDTKSRDQLTTKSLDGIEMMTKEDYISDLEYLVDKISSRHLSAADGLPQAVRNQYNEELSRWHEDFTTIEMWQSASRILKTLEDAHSGARLIIDQSRKVDFELKMTDEKVYVTSGAYKNAQVTAIDGERIEAIYERFLSQFSYENIYWAEVNFPLYLTNEVQLAWLNVGTSDFVDYEINQDGVMNSVSCSLIEELPSENQPEAPFVSYEIMKDDSIGIFTLKSCDYNDEYTQTLASFFETVSKEGIENVIVDLRHNSGGNSMVANDFMSYLPIEFYQSFGTKIRYGSIVKGYESSKDKIQPKAPIYEGNLYVLTSRDTFSSATMFSVMLRDNNLCTIVGEPSGNKPSAYGDILIFQLPKSQIAFTLTYKQFTRPDVTLDKEPALWPDVTVSAEGALEETIARIRGE